MTARDRVRRFALAGVAIAVVTAIGYLVFWPSWIHPVAWQPEPNPGFTGVFAPNTHLAGVERVMRLWLRGEQRGKSDVFLGGLPGNPDNVTFDGAGTFWLALFSPRSRPFERWGPHPFPRAVVAKIPRFDPPHPIPAFRTKEFHGWVIGVDTTGVVRVNLQGPPGGYGAVTSANAYDGNLYLGSIRMTAVGRIAVPPASRSVPTDW